jgi:hypothetical protein
MPKANRNQPRVRYLNPARLVPIPGEFTTVVPYSNCAVNQTNSVGVEVHRPQGSADGLSVGVVAGCGAEAAAELLDEVRCAGVADRRGHIRHTATLLDQKLAGPDQACLLDELIRRRAGDVPERPRERRRTEVDLLGQHGHRQRVGQVSPDVSQSRRNGAARG